MGEQGKVIQLDPGLIGRVGGLSRWRSGKLLGVDWFGPGTPIPPVAPDYVRGRALDYPFGWNLRYRPREETPGLSFAQLRAMADSFDILRILIENRKDKVCDIPWVIKPKDHDKAPDARCDEVAAFLQQPEPDWPWELWIRRILEDWIVIDAVAIMPRMTNGGKLYALEQIDGALIKRLIGEDGRTPMPPDPAYQQIIKGMPAIDYTRDELFYFMRNPRSWKLYGYSKVEQIIMTIQMALNKQLFTLDYYTAGSVPDAICNVPEDWTPLNIKEFQEYFDLLLSGELSERRKVRFVPPGKYTQTKEPDLKNAFDEWLTRVCCFVMGVSAQAFISNMNRATAETAADAAQEEGVHPWKRSVKSMMDVMIARIWGYTDLEFDFEVSEEIDPQVRSAIDDKAVRNGTATINEIRSANGDDPIEGGDDAFIVVGNQITLVRDLAAMSEKALAPTPAPIVPDPGKQVASESKVPALPAPEKLQKAKRKKIKPIDHNRGSLILVRQVMSDALQAALKKIAHAVAEKAGKHFDKAMKSSEDKDIEEIIDGLALQQEFDALRDLISNGQQKAAADGYVAATVQVGAQGQDMFDLANENAEAYAAEHAAESITAIEDVTRDKLRSLITQAVEEGWSRPELASEIEQSYAFSADRAALIAGTEVRTAEMQGNLAGYKASGVVEKKVWVTANDDLVDDEVCGPNGDQGAILLDDDFQSGDDAPPGHPRCRCDLAPVVYDADELEEQN